MTVDLADNGGPFESVDESPPTPTGDGNRRGRIVVRAVHGSRGRYRGRRADNHHRNEPPHAVPAPS